MHNRNTVFLKDKINIQGLHQISDYEYDWFGNRLAVSDSDGNIVIYQRDAQGKFKYSSQFHGSDSAIWKISWAHPKYGDLIGVASFTKKVSVFQKRNNDWTEIAFHTLHEGSVNEVKWAPYYYGLKLFACSSDGNFSVLEVKGNAWHAQLFEVREPSINSIAIQKKSIVDQDNQGDSEYPMVATGGKDKRVIVWKYKQGQYQEFAAYLAHKDAVRNILWRKPVAISDDSEVFSCSEDGIVKILSIKQNGSVKEKAIYESSHPILRLSQNLTGGTLIASTQDPNKSIVLRQLPTGEWNATDQIN